MADASHLSSSAPYIPAVASAVAVSHANSHGAGNVPASACTSPDGSTWLPSVAVLFARPDSNYKSIQACDVYDIQRDARTYTGTLPVIAHLPCRAWGRLRQFAKPRHDEKQLALFALEQVRRCGGVLEHPAWSTLWETAGIPSPGTGYDEYGGWTLGICQKDFGHRALKPTWLYIVGISPSELPHFPLTLGRPTHCIRPGKTYPRLPSVTKPEREHTPALLASWLSAIAAASREVHRG